MNAPRPISTVRGLSAYALCGALAFLFFLRPIHDDDVWLHFAVGRWILDRGEIPRVDLFSCTAPGVPYVDHEWLAQVITEWVRAGFGLGAFRALMAGSAAAAFVLMARTTHRLTGSALAPIVVTLSALAFDWHLARLRPHLFTLLCTAILIDRFVVAVTNAPLRSRRDVLPSTVAAAGLCVLMVFWGNVHAAAVIAPAILGVAAAGAWMGAQGARAARLAALTAASALLLLVNPYGFDVVTYAFETQGMAELIPEWKSPLVLVTDPREVARMTAGNDFRATLAMLALAAAVVFPLAGWALLAARRAAARGAAAAVDPALGAAGAALVALAFTANRHDLFLFVGILFAAHALAELGASGVRGAGLSRGLGALAGVIAFFALARDAALRIPLYVEATGSAFGIVWPAHEPFAAVDLVEKAGLEGACLNRPPWGGYLLYRCFPQVTVAFDGRITTLGADVYRDIRDLIEGRRTQEVLARYSFDFLVLPPYVLGYGKPRENPQYQAPQIGADWVEVYRDPDVAREGSAVIALRRGSPRFEANLARMRALK